MKNILTTIAIGSSLVACGGGSGGGSASAPMNPASPNTPVIATINVADVFQKLITSPQTISNIPATDKSGGTATVIIGSVESYPFVTNGNSVITSSTRTIQFQRLSSAGILLRQNLWKFHFDADKNPIGLASGTELFKYSECMSVASKSALPTSSSSSGTFFQGSQTGNYVEGFRSGKYANYCDPTPSSAVGNVDWAVIEDSSIQYFCLTTPNYASTPKTRLCVPVDKTGALGTSLWLRTYSTDGSVASEYRSK